MQHTLMTDQQLAQNVTAGDPRAVSLFYEHYRYGLFRFCSRLLSDPVSAEDVVHDTFMILLNKKDQLRDPSVLRSWIFTIARNECITLLRKNKKFRTFRDDEEASVFEGPSERTESDERSMIAERLLNALLPQYKEVILLKEYEGLSYEEIAAVTDTTVSSVKSRLFKARRSMMKLLEPYNRGTL